MEQLDYNLLFRWFVGLSMDDKVWDHSTFSKNRDRLIAHDVATQFFWTIRLQAENAGSCQMNTFPLMALIIPADSDKLENSPWWPR